MTVLNRAARVFKARDAAARALELDDSLAEAHFGHGEFWHTSTKLAPAEPEFKRALALNPQCAPAQYFYGILVLSQTGRTDEAIAGD